MRALMIALDEQSAQITHTVARAMKLEVVHIAEWCDAKTLLHKENAYDLLLCATTDDADLLYVRSQCPITPIIIVSDSPSIGQAVAYLQSGVADYIPRYELSEQRLLTAMEKSLQMRRLMERFQPLANRLLNFHPFLAQLSFDQLANHTSIEGHIYRVGDLEIDDQRLVVMWRGEDLWLSPTEYNILRLLAQAMPQVVTFEDIVYHLQKVHVRRNEARMMLSAHISNLRAKLRAVRCDHYLVNRRGQGYALEADPTVELRRAQGRLQRIAENSSDILGWMDTNGVIHYMNAAVERVLGYAPEEFIGRSVFDLLSLIHPQDAQFWAQRLREQRYNESLDQFRVRHANGDYIWLEASSRLIKGKPTGDIFFIMRDITERKTAEEALRYSEERLRLLFKSSPNPAYLWKREGDDLILVDYSDSALEYTQLGIRHYLGARLGDITPQIYQPYIWRCLESGEPQIFEYDDVMRTTGQRVHAIVRCTRVATDTVLIHSTDITDRVHLEYSLRESENMLRALMDNLPMWVARFDKNGRCIFMNPVSKFVFGRPLEFFLGRTIQEMGIANPQFVTNWERLIEEAIQTKKAIILKAHHTLSDETYWYVKAVVPEWDEIGALKGYLCAVLPIIAFSDEIDYQNSKQTDNFL